jgi:type III restriction enzyme
METGTGKTYVYLRTIFELNKTYGFKKFIIVVPSVAIREGVLKSIDVTKEHFQTLYEKVPFDHFVYDSKRLGKVRQFASNNQIQIMVINIQSFQKDVADKDLSEMTEDELKKLNVINRENDRMSGRRPIEFIQAVNPIVIIDEPQSVDNTEKSRRAIGNLNPMVTLRYSASTAIRTTFCMSSTRSRPMTCGW